MSCPSLFFLENEQKLVDEEETEVDSDGGYIYYYYRKIYALACIYIFNNLSTTAAIYNFPRLLAISSCNTIPTGPPRLPSPAHFSSGIRSAGHSQRPLKSSGVRPCIHSTMLSPMTGRNLKPCPEPPVATNNPLYLGWYEIKKSPSLVSVYQQIFDLVNGREGVASDG